MNENVVKKNQGLSLVELLVSVVILAIALSGIMAIINLASKYYSHSSKEVEIQSELQTTFAIVSNMIVDADVDVSYAPATNAGVARIINDTKAYLVGWKNGKLYVRDNVDVSSATTRAAKIAAAASQDPYYSSAYVLSDHVEYFSIDTSGYDQGYVTLAMHLKYGNREARMSRNVFLRNSENSYQNIIGQCDLTRTAGVGSLSTVVKQNTGSAIPANTKLTVNARLAVASGTLNAAGITVSSTNGTFVVKAYNQITGLLTISGTTASEWADGTTVTFTLTVDDSTVHLTADKCYMTGIGR